MSISATLKTTSPDLRGLLKSFAPGKAASGYLGLALGMRAYRVYVALDAKSDAELAEMGISRCDVPRVAFDAI